MDCPRMRMCIVIARKCMNADKDKRPTICQVIRELGDLESMIPRSSVNQICERRGLLFRQIGKQSDQALIVCSALTAASVMYTGFPYAPGGYETYSNNALSMALKTALFCSYSTTISFMLAEVALHKFPHLRISIWWLSSSRTSLVSALALHLYLNFAPNELVAATVICPSAFLVCSTWRTALESSGGISAATKQLARMARKAFLVFSCGVVISVRTLAAYWPWVIIFGCCYLCENTGSTLALGNNLRLGCPFDKIWRQMTTWISSHT